MTLKICLTLKTNAEITLKNIYKGNHVDNHTEIFSFVDQGDCNHTGNF